MHRDDVAWYRDRHTAHTLEYWEGVADLGFQLEETQLERGTFTTRMANPAYPSVFILVNGSTAQIYLGHTHSDGARSGAALRTKITKITKLIDEGKRCEWRNSHGWTCGHTALTVEKGRAKCRGHKGMEDAPLRNDGGAMSLQAVEA